MSALTLTGSGVAPENYEALAMKHYTSKLKEFSDLDGVSSFGFRCAAERCCGNWRRLTLAA